MAKKTVASLQVKGAKSFTKLIRTVRSEKTGAYTFKEEMIPADKLQEALAKK